MAKARPNDAPPTYEKQEMFDATPETPRHPEPGTILPPTPANGTPARKKPERVPLSGDLQAAAKIDRVLGKMTPHAAIATLEYLLSMYEAKVGLTSN